MTRNPPPRGCCAAFGCFDGMHAGHLSLLRALSEHAHKTKRPGLLISVPAPAPVLTTEDEKAVYAESSGVDAMVTLPAPDLPAEAFVREVLCRRFGVACLVLGEDPAPGGYALSEIDAAARACGIEIARVECGGAIPAARLHRALDEGDPETYARLCGHPYLMLGRVVHGRGLGHTVGMPTANQALPREKKIPAEGVYASIAAFDGENHIALTNIGRRPSVDDEDRITIETNLFDFDRDIYGREMLLELRFFIRGVRKFDDLRAVREQVQKDREQVLARLC